MRTIKPTKLPKRIKTVNELLTPCRVSQILDRALERKSQITNLIVIYQDREGFTTVDTSDKNELLVRGLLDKAHDIYVDPDIEENDDIGETE